MWMSFTRAEKQLVSPMSIQKNKMTITELSEPLKLNLWPPLNVTKCFRPGKKLIAVLLYQRFVVASVLKRQLHKVNHCSVSRISKVLVLKKIYILFYSGLPRQLPLHDKSIQIKVFGDLPRVKKYIYKDTIGHRHVY